MLGLGTTLCKPPAVSGDPPVLDRTFNFDSDVEGWTGLGTSVDFISSFTPSNATERTGILRVKDETSGSFAIAQVNLSSLSGYDSSKPLYYRVSYSVSSTTDFVSVHSVIYGTGGSSQGHLNSATLDEWSEVSGELTNSGPNNLFQIRFQTSPTSTLNEYAHIDFVRVSHEDFR